MDNQTNPSLLDNETTTDPSHSILNGSSSDDGMTDEDWFGFITEGIMLTSISICGFIGNILSVWVLLRTTLKGNFSYQLTSLAGKNKYLLSNLEYLSGSFQKKLFEDFILVSLFFVPF
jgi:hypothetical protein